MADVFLYIPNIIGYFRALLLAFAYFVYPARQSLFVFSYVLSFGLDAVDGWAARRYGQSSRFGECLDMLTDRMATLMLCFLAFALPRAPNRGFLLLYTTIDITAHWLQQLAATHIGAHHKRTLSPFSLLNVYYADKRVMAALCIGAEAFFLSYIWQYSNGGSISAFCLRSSLPLVAMKAATNVMQILTSAQVIGRQLSSN